MSQQRRRLFAAVPIAAAAGAVLVALAFLASPRQQALAAAPRATAGFQTAEELVLAVELPALKEGKRAPLTVELLGPGDKVIEKQAPDMPGREESSLRIAFKRPKEQPGRLTLRLSSGGKSVRVPLSEILLTKAHETAISTSTEFFADSEASLRCSVRGVKSLFETVPLSSQVTVQLHLPDKKVRTLYKGQSGSGGVADVRFKVPDLPAGSYELTVQTKSALGEETLKRSVKVQTAAKVLLTTDKPLYQPGQTIHIRALALRAFDLAAAGNKEVTLEVEDGKGNKVFKKILKTSDYGIAHADFTLADEVNMGDFRVRASMEQHQAEKSVAVKRYVLPKFKSQLTTDRTFYLPKEKVKGELQVDYFFGKPVVGGAVEVKASTFDVAFKEFATFKGKTDKNGHVKFEFTLPDYFVGLPLTKGNAVVKLEASVTDTADHSETVAKMVPVSDKPIQVSLIPEAGRLVPGIENTLFVAALYPDGSPAACTVEVWLGQQARGKSIATLTTNEAGLAEMKITPKSEQLRNGGWGQQNVEMLGGTQQRWMPNNLFDLTSQASDRKGNKAINVSHLTSEPLGENVLIRLDKSIYKGGENLKVDVRTSAGMPTAYLDVIKSGQVMLTRWLDVKNGQAQATLDLPATLFGTLEVHAYQVLASGEIIRDSRVVYVNPADELKVKVTADKDTYLPGHSGTIRFEVTDSAGKPTPAALGVLVVDEAVYALQEMQPGLEKVFFTLQQELLKPAVQVNYKPQEGINNLILRRNLNQERQRVARVLFSSVKPKPPARWEENPDHARRQKFRGVVQQIGQALFNYAAQYKPVIEKDKKSGEWRFRPDLLDELVKANHLRKEQLSDGIGGAITLESLGRASTHFTADQLARAITQQRMNQIAWTVHAHVQNNLGKFKKGGKWELPKTLLADAIASAKQDARPLDDAWGNKLSFRPRSKDEPNTFGGAFYEDHNLVSAGPDGKFGTKDDIAFRHPFDYWRQAVLWWDLDQRQPARHNQLAWRDGRYQMFAPWQLGRFGGGRGGFFPPGAPMARKAAGGGVELDKAQAFAVPSDARNAKATAANEAGAGAAPPRLREYFPETLLWQPALITDESGKAKLDLTLADSITTWRLSASASSRGGLLGGATAALRVFQDFFVDLDLPVALTQNDEVAFPVAVYNYLKTDQTVTLTLNKSPWFTLVDGDYKRSLDLKAGEVTAVRFRIKAKRVGAFPLQVDARGSKMSDAVKRLIEVLPDGSPREQVFTDRLKGTVTHTVNVPNNAIEGASRLFVKVYPGVMSQVVEGLDGMLRMPNGCFEQTSSSAYPNILVVDYLKKSRTASPALMLKCETLLSAGYQRLLTFERPGGGFDWWGSGPPLIWLSAYGLQEFNDMAKVYPVDRGVIQRTQAWLLKQQAADGTWSKIGATHGESIERMGDPKLLLTSYVTWAILDSMPRPANWKKSPEYPQLKKAVEYIREHAPKADNAYILALCANALASWDATDDSTFDVVKRVLRKLDEKKVRNAEWKAIAFPAGGQSLCYGRGDSMTVETTALAVLAMVKNGQFTGSVNQALTYLVKTKGAQGHWGSTQATILALKALLAGMGGTEHKGVTPFVVKVNGKQVGEGKVTKDNCDVMQMFDLKEHLQAGDNEVSLVVKGETALMYQVVGRVFLPRGKDKPEVKPIMEVGIDYDRTRLSTKDVLKATATLEYHGKTPTFNVILDLPIPPGFTADGGDFAEMVASRKVQKFSVTSRQVILYLGDVKAGEKYTFTYSLKPKYPVKAKAPAAVAYEYYTPANRASSKPVLLTVESK
jgi:hypothetical protein